MGNFNRDNRFGGNKNKRNFGGGGRGFGGNDGGRPQMFKATCSKCGQECEIPFKPTGDRPVFCNVCFRSQGNANARPGAKSFGKPSFGDKQMHEAVCAKCGNKCQVPFTPMAGKPVYCNQCFDRTGNTGGKGAPQSKEQFDILNAKLDKILRALTPAVSAETVQEKKAPAETKKSKNVLLKTKAVAKKAAAKKKK